MFLITGCGRSATSYTAAVLRAAGLDVGHEGPGADGAVSSLWAVRDSTYPAWHAQGRPQFGTVLHQVRHPLPTIGSLTTALDSSLRWDARHIELDLRQGRVLVAAQYWLNWNLLCEARAQHRFRIEAVTPLFRLIAPGVPVGLNSREHRSVRWRDLGRYETEVREMARRYGYED
jgi:hypothetical protein